MNVIGSFSIGGEQMIRESLYFSYAGRKSTDFGIINISITDGLYDEQIVSNKTINEFSVRGNPKPYLVDVSTMPKQFQLRFYFEEKWNDDLIDEIIRWLNVDYYEPLFFSEDIDKIFYAMPIEGINLIHNGLKQGYLTLTMRCDSPYCYSPVFTKGWFKNQSQISIYNLGHYSIYPELWIQKVGDGDLIINNLSNENREFKLVNLMDKEVVYFDCENEIIETSLSNTSRYDDFNDNFLCLPYGNNVLNISGEANLKFRFRYIYS